LLVAGLVSADTRAGLRRKGRDGDHGHHSGGHGASHGAGRGGRRNNRRNNRRNQARQAFESGGYLAATDDYDTASLPGYVPEGDAQGTAVPDYAEYDDSAAAAGDYAGPGGADDPSLGYDAPGGDAGALSDDSYAAPGDDYAAGDETSTDIAAYDDTLPGYDEDEALDSYDAGADGQADYDPAAQEARRRRNGKSPAVGRAFRSNAVRNTKFCPGGRLNSCIAICPGGTPRVYASCVTSCGNRCPTRN